MIQPPSPRDGVYTKSSDFTVAMPSRPATRWALLLAGFALTTALVLVYVSIHTGLRYPWQRQNAIGELRELPLGQVKVRGVVTYVDRANKRFWLQDETGAISVDKDPTFAGVHFGDVLLVEMKKTHSYDPAVGVP